MRAKWISDYHFKKAMSHRLELARAAPGVVTSALGEPRKMLLLWGSVRDGSLRMEPAFAMEAPVKLPARPGPYRLTGVAEAAKRSSDLTSPRTRSTTAARVSCSPCLSKTSGPKRWAGSNFPDRRERPRWTGTPEAARQYWSTSPRAASEAS